MNIPIEYVYVVAGAASLYLIQKLRNWLASRARQPAPVCNVKEPDVDMATVIVSPECKAPLGMTPHSLMVAGWREELTQRMEDAAEARDVLVEIRREEIETDVRLDEMRAEVAEHHAELQATIAELRAVLDEEGKR